MKEQIIEYSAKEVDKIKTKPDCWNHTKIGVFKNIYNYNKLKAKRELIKSEEIGSYVRNYNGLFNTFFPFKQNNKWYALYSKSYTYTSVMELPSCKELLTEECKYEEHFCPTDYYVPIIKKLTDNYVSYEEAEKLDHYKREDGSFDFNKWYADCILFDYADFGFVAGCHWGDDSSHKLQYLDLSSITEGKIQRDARFGYLELPDGSNLRDIVNCDLIDPEYKDNYDIKIGCSLSFNYKTGKLEQEGVSMMNQDFLERPKWR